MTMNAAIQKFSRGLRVPPADRRATVLVAEDDDDLREMLVRALEGQGHEVLSARHGAEAVERVLAHGGRLDLVVTDLMMPFLNGAALTSLVQKAHPKAQVLYLTGYPLEDLHRWDILDATTPRLQKPFSMRDLLRIVEGLLRD